MRVTRTNPLHQRSDMASPRHWDARLSTPYLTADLRLDRTRAVLATLLGVGEHTRSYAQFQAPEVRVVSGSGPQRVAFDGEMGEVSTEFVFRKRAPLTVYCTRGSPEPAVGARGRSLAGRAAAALATVATDALSR